MNTISMFKKFLAGLIHQTSICIRYLSRFVPNNFLLLLAYHQCTNMVESCKCDYTLYVCGGQNIIQNGWLLKYFFVYLFWIYEITEVPKMNYNSISKHCSHLYNFSKYLLKYTTNQQVKGQVYSIKCSQHMYMKYTCSQFIKTIFFISGKQYKVY